MEKEYIYIYIYMYIYVHICIAESLCCTSETNAYYKSTIFQFKKLKNNKAHL